MEHCAPCDEWCGDVVDRKGVPTYPGRGLCIDWELRNPKPKTPTYRPWVQGWMRDAILPRKYGGIVSHVGIL